jgi:catechol 2,3-dioxygenase-like lactoylglutathione lyase family enzyme
MEVLNSRVLLRPTDPEPSRAFYRDTLGLAIYREFGDGPERGTVFFLGGGFLELSGRAAEPPAPGMALWLQVRDLVATRQELGERGVGILREPRREPWGLLEMWIADPDGLRIGIVEVPAEHPLRRRDWPGAALRAAGAAQVEIEEYLVEAASGDDDHLRQPTMRWVDWP